MMASLIRSQQPFRFTCHWKSWPLWITAENRVTMFCHYFSTKIPPPLNTDVCHIISTIQLQLRQHVHYIQPLWLIKDNLYDLLSTIKDWRTLRWSKVLLRADSSNSVHSVEAATCYNDQYMHWGYFPTSAPTHQHRHRVSLLITHSDVNWQ